MNILLMNIELLNEQIDCLKENVNKYVSQS